MFNLSISTIDTLARILSTVGDKPFYAKDVDADGGVMSALSKNQLIEETGKSHYEFVCVNEDDETYKRFVVKEWKINYRYLNIYKGMLDRKIDSLNRLSAVLGSTY